MSLAPNRRRRPASAGQDPEDFLRDIHILNRLSDGSDAATAAVTALFDPTPAGTVNVISHSFVTHQGLGPVEYYSVTRRDATVATASTLPLRIIGELEARWCGIDKRVLGQRIVFAPKYYSSSFLVMDDEVASPYSVIFGLQTMRALQLFH